jgi:hypothetical protein
MSKEQMVRERMEGILKIEWAVEQGQDGLVEVREMYEKGVMGADIVRMLKEDVRKVVLAAFIDNFCE